MTQRFAGFRLVFAVVALALWAGDAANAQVERTPTAENVVRNVKRTPTPNANPGVAPRRVSEETTAGSRSANNGARVGTADVTGGRSSGFSRDGVDSSLDGCTPDINDIVCCLTGCESKFDKCNEAIDYSCPAGASVATAPFICLLEFKCCVHDECIDCNPSDCCVATTPCTDATAASDCCSSFPFCCEDTCSEDDCCSTTACTDATDCCSSFGFCCEGTCSEDDCCGANECCGSMVETCFARDNRNRNKRCCFIDGEGDPQTNEDAGDCGNTLTTFNRWGWTNGPYNVERFLWKNPLESWKKHLKVYCAAGQCDITKDDVFTQGSVKLESDGSQIIVTWPPGTAQDWEVHLGCGSGDGTAPPPADSGVYPIKEFQNKPDEYTVAPGQYANKLSSTDELILYDPGLASCNKLWVIVHTCGMRGAD